MLSEKMRNRALFDYDDELVMMCGRVEKALNILDECVDHLVLGMKTIESLGILDREDIEAYVLWYLEAYEKRYYTMGEDEYDKWLMSYLKRR